jgi:hypothetical protein
MNKFVETTTGRQIAVDQISEVRDLGGYVLLTTKGDEEFKTDAHTAACVVDLYPLENGPELIALWFDPEELPQDEDGRLTPSETPIAVEPLGTAVFLAVPLLGFGEPRRTTQDIWSSTACHPRHSAYPEMAKAVVEETDGVYRWLDKTYDCLEQVKKEFVDLCCSALNTKARCEKRLAEQQGVA